MTWVKGAPNPGINRDGRKAGSRMSPSRGELFVFRASQTGKARVFFTEAMDEPRVPLEFRMLAAREIAKWQIQSDPPLEHPVPLIDPQCAGDAERNIATIMHFEATGRIGHASATALCARQSAWIESHVISTVQFEAREALKQFAELRHHLQGQTVLGGLPELPGSSVSMPSANTPWGGTKDEGKS
jgi:hypothetical protein